MPQAAERRRPFPGTLPHYGFPSPAPTDRRFPPRTPPTLPRAPTPNCRLGSGRTLPRKHSPSPATAGPGQAAGPQTGLPGAAAPPPSAGCAPPAPRLGSDSLLYWTPLANLLCRAWFMDCSPAGIFLSLTGVWSEPTSFFRAENIFLVPHLRRRLREKGRGSGSQGQGGPGGSIGGALGSGGGRG